MKKTQAVLYALTVAALLVPGAVLADNPANKGERDADAAELVTSTNIIAGAACDVVDVTGVESWDLVGDADNEVIMADYSAGPCLDVMDIGWTGITLTTVGASWGSEAELQPSASDGSGAFAIQFFPGSDSTGTFGPASGSAGMGVTLLGDMVLRMEFYETFDDVAGAVDANYNAGTVEVVGSVVPVELLDVNID